MKLIIDMTPLEASNFLLKHESYCNFPLPPYFDFSTILNAVKNSLDQKPNGLNDVGLKSAKNYYDVNYVVQSNKDGAYSWRPFQLIHPALYVHLVSVITKPESWALIKERFSTFRSNKSILVASLPREVGESGESDAAESVIGRWNDVEQLSIEKALDFRYLFCTDIANFYPSIYTHSISWALHTKETAKRLENRRNFGLIGVVMDYAIQSMQNGQTNGIPQGSVLMDFVSEIVLGYADSELSEKLEEANLDDYYIIRYRDDYRVFTNSREDSEIISRAIALTLQELGLQLNASKTNLSEDVVLDSIKKDKLEAINFFGKGGKTETIQQALLKLLIFSRKHSNSGQLSKQLSIISGRLSATNELHENYKSIVSVISDLMIKNPVVFPMCTLVLSKLLKFVTSDEEKLAILTKVHKKLGNLLGTELVDVWLQRMTYAIDPELEYSEALCGLVVNDSSINVWNSDWITESILKNHCLSVGIVNRIILEECSAEIADEEVSLFAYDVDPFEEEEAE